jgi:hypothetical protein
MSLERREALVEEIVAKQPPLGSFVRDLSTDLAANSWDLVSYSFQRGFEAMWDLARVDHSGLLLRPLLSLWRQSVELAIKSAIVEIAGHVEGKPSHNLQTLFAQLLRVCASGDCGDDDGLTRDVQSIIARVQSFDPFADRFRYPLTYGGSPRAGIAVDFDELFQAHWIVTTWCEGTVIEFRERQPGIV